MSKKRVKAGASKGEAAAKRDLFVKAFIGNGGNATQAAISAGYSKKTAYSAGGRLLKHVEVSTAIEAQRKAAAESAGLTVERTLREVARLAYFDPAKLYDESGNLLHVPQMDADTRAAIAGVEVTEEFEGRGEARESVGFTRKIKHCDKNAALEKAMKHLGLYELDNKQKPAPAVHLPGVKTVKFEPLSGRGKRAA